ncbi:hypothetical protein MMMB2_1339 [Mycobacterium marinum MB2]|nr:hypothetical protein MMMB2_1339 [Mycobacterium marinum MB2]
MAQLLRHRKLAVPTRCPSGILGRRLIYSTVAFLRVAFAAARLRRGEFGTQWRVPVGVAVAIRTVSASGGRCGPARRKHRHIWIASWLAATATNPPGWARSAPSAMPVSPIIPAPLSLTPADAGRVVETCRTVGDPTDRRAGVSLDAFGSSSVRDSAAASWTTRSWSPTPSERSECTGQEGFSWGLSCHPVAPL